jgi:hypothetical protein
MDKEGPFSIEDLQSEILKSIQPQPLYAYIEPCLGTPVKPLFITDVASAIATLYVGYQLGQKIDEVGTALAYTIHAIGDVAKGLANILNRIAEVIDAINQAIKILSRKIDSAFMTEHMSRMNTASLNIQDILLRLSTLPEDQNTLANPFVVNQVAQLQQEASSLLYAINGFAAHDGSPPTVASFVNCAPAIALYSQTYTYIERYNISQLRVPIWDTKKHSSFVQLYAAFFNYTENTISRYEEELEHKYLIPGLDYTCRFEQQRFVRTNIPNEPSYPNNPQYSNLFARREATPFNFFVTKHSFLGFGWTTAQPDGSGSDDPALISAAVKWHEDARPHRQERRHFLTQYNPVLKEKARTMAAFNRPAGW